VGKLNPRSRKIALKAVEGGITSMIFLAAIWFVFTVIFLSLGCYHWRMAGRRIPDFQIRGRQFPEGNTAYVEIKGVDFGAFVNQFNEYVNYYNQTTKKQNKTQAIGYWVASGTAVLSFITIIATAL